MGEIAAVVSDPADSREFVCILPDNAAVSAVAARLAELARFPLTGPQGEPVNYGFVARGGPALDPDAPLGKIDIPEPVVVRLVPELTIGAGQGSLPMDENPMSAEPEPPRVTIVQERCLIHDDGLDLRADVSIDAAAHREIERFAARDRHAECGGLLLGTVSVERKARSIHVEAVAPALGAVETRTSVRITFDAWKSMLGLRDSDYPQLRVLGWFHAHAGWGVFLSEIDLFVHERFFPHPNMVAYVLDPTSGGESFFNWRDGRVVQCPTYGLVGSPREIGPRKRARRRRAVALGVCVAGAGIAVGLYTGLARPQAEPPKRAAAPVARQSAPAPPPKPSEPVERTYFLHEGETLWGVCERVYGDARLGPALGRYNGIRRVARVRIGRQIKLPPEEELRKLGR